MRNVLNLGLGMVPLVLAALGVASPAQAQHHHHHHHGGYGYYSGGYSGGYYPTTAYYPQPVYTPPAQVYTPPVQVYTPPVTTPPQTMPIQFGSFTHTSELAHQLEQQANGLCWTMYRDYHHNPGYADTYRAAYEMLTTARYVHGLEHGGANRERIRRAALDMDGLFHQITQFVQPWSADHDFHGWQGLGQLGIQLGRMEQTLHHFLTDAGVQRPTPAVTTGTGNVPPQQPQFSPQPQFSQPQPQFSQPQPQFSQPPQQDSPPLSIPAPPQQQFSAPPAAELPQPPSGI